MLLLHSTESSSNRVMMEGNLLFLNASGDANFHPPSPTNQKKYIMQRTLVSSQPYAFLRVLRNIAEFRVSRKLIVDCSG